MTAMVENMAAAAIRPDDRVKLSLSSRPGLFPSKDGDIVGVRAAMVA